MDSIKILMVLEAVRKKGSPSYPACDNWGYLEEQLAELEQEGLLEIKDAKYVISKNGKKTLLTFDSERRDILKELEVYKEVITDNGVIDARLPICAFRTRKLKPEQQLPHLEMVALALYWDEFFGTLKGLSDSVLWQKVLFTSFDNTLKQLADRYAWRKMGKTVDAAVLTCERLLKPIPEKKLIQIQR